MTTEPQIKTERLQAMLAAEKLGGVLINAQHNFSWLTCGGSNGIDLSRANGSCFVLVRADGRRFLIANRIEMPRLLAEEVSEEDFEPVELSWQEEKASFAIVVSTAKSLLESDSPLGSDMLMADHLRDAEPQISACRYSLTDAEIGRYRTLGRDTGRLIGEALSEVCPGETESQIAAKVRAKFWEAGIISVVTLVGADDRIGRFRHPVPTENIWRKTLLVAVCARRQGLIACLSRIVCVGDVPGELQRRTQIVAEVNARLYAATRPGATGAELYRTAETAYADLGFAREIDNHHQGGACGYRTRDWTALPTSSETVRMHQAFAWNPSLTGTKVEETGIVTADGFEGITSTPGFPQISTVVDGRKYLFSRSSFNFKRSISMNEIAGNVEDFEEPKSEAEISPPEEAASTFTGSVAAAAGEISERIGRRRWAICALLFFAATVNYVDRQVIGILKPTLQSEFGWTEVDYGWIVFSFQTAYAIGLFFVGRLMDRVGTKIGFALSIILWSVAAVGHAFAVAIGGAAFVVVAWAMSAMGYDPVATVASASVLGFIVVRFLLGLGESGNFPASIKTVSEWFPKKERALATGIFNAGTNVGALATPLLVPVIVAKWGWYEAFIFTGVLGFIWLLFWLLFYKRPEYDPRLSKRELDYIQSDPQEPTARVPWGRLFPHRQTWAFGIGKFLTDPIWWVYLFWLPDFLSKQYGLDLKSFGIPLAVIYIIADVGSVGGGYISGALIKRGWTINKSRKTAMLVCALAVVPIVFASMTSSLWLAVLLIGIAAAAHQGWSANIFTISSDMFPKQAVGSVVGIGGMMGAVGGMIISPLVGYILQTTGSYVPIFMIAASAYLVALLIIHLLAPKLEPAAIKYE